MSFVGTPGYLAPEVLACTNGPGALGYGQAADMWALGCVLYEMAALRPAFAGDRVPVVYRLIRRGRVPPLPGGYSPQLAALYTRLMAVDPHARPSSADLLQDELLRCAVLTCLCSMHACGIAANTWPSTNNHSRTAHEQPLGPQIHTNQSTDFNTHTCTHAMSSHLAPALPPPPPGLTSQRMLSDCAASVSSCRRCRRRATAAAHITAPLALIQGATRQDATVVAVVIAAAIGLMVTPHVLQSAARRTLQPHHH